MATHFSRRQFIISSGLTVSGIMLGCSVRNQFNLVIRNGNILDGSGRPGVMTDIGIAGNRITAIGDLSTATTDQSIDAAGLIVCPGFIDIHTHTETELLINPRGESKILQGVTTEIGGNCGSSPFPLNDEDFASLKDHYAEQYGIDISWHRLEGFLRALEEKKISLNYAIFTGHGDLRAFAVGKNDVVPTSEQMDKMKALLAESMEMGSLGLSTGLEYAPGSYAKTDELIELSKVVAAAGGVYATHMRNEDDTLEEAVEEALKISREAKVSLQISHLKACNEANWYKIDHVLQMIESAAQGSLPVKADRYPYIAYGTGLTTFLPLWSRQGSRDEVLARLEDGKLLKDIEQYALSRGKRIGGWKRVLISSCHTDENKNLEGLSIQEGATQRGVSPFEFIRTLLLEEKNRVGIVGFAMNEDNLKKVLASPLVMVGSDGSAVAPYGKLGRGKPHPRFYGTFPRVLGKYCRDDKCLDLAEGIHKMTAMPAEKLNLKKRGKILKDYYADITIFDPEKVIDKATFTDPHQPAAGIKYVLVNGTPTVKDGKHLDTFAGMVLRHSQA